MDALKGIGAIAFGIAGNRPVKMTLCALAISLIPGSLANADPQECGEAASRYNSSLDDVSSALRSYTMCVSDSRGHDDCSLEFSTLQSAQDDFESAVSEYETECS